MSAKEILILFVLVLDFVALCCLVWAWAALRRAGRALQRALCLLDQVKAKGKPDA